MSERSLDRRRLLAIGGSTLAGAALVGAATSAETVPACRAVHDRLARELEGFAARARLAANNVYSTAWDIACPCCGEPLFAAAEERPRF